MGYKKNFVFIIFVFLIIPAFISYLLYSSISKKQDEYLKNIYKLNYKNISERIENLINDKQTTSLAIALSLSKDENLFNHFTNSDFQKIKYEKVSKLIEDNSKYKNVWFQILDKNRNSLYRSWTDIKDGVQFRSDLKNQEILKKISTSISAGLFNIGIKARVPIFDENDIFYGALEVITHFDSISDDLAKNSINPIIIADKKFTANLKYPMFSKTFVDDYYIANENADKTLVDYISKNGIEKYINQESYVVENGYLITNFSLKNEKNEKIGSILCFYSLSNIDISHLNSLKMQNILTIAIVLIILFFTLILLIYTKYTNNLKKEEQKSRLILDSQSSIIVITNGVTLLEANKQLLSFFNDIETLDEFRKKHTCICTKFVDIKKENYLLNIDYNGKNWAEHTYLNQDIDFKVAIYDYENSLKHFSVKVNKIEANSTLIATFTDITYEILENQRRESEQKNIFQQAKLNAITNTLNSLAHQWRQPLSVISTLSSGMKLKKELNVLSDAEFIKSCDYINLNTQKLSNTIENFTNFFTKEDINKVSVVESINELIKFLDTILDKHNIICIFEEKEDLILNCNSNMFSEIILNIFDNSISSLIENKNENERFIIISLKDKNLKIKDSGGGVSEEIVSKLMEPYFTTKHESFGVGLGLYVVEEFFSKNFNKTIKLENETFIYKDKKLKGLSFSVDFD